MVLFVQQVSVAQWVRTAAIDADILGLNLDVYTFFSFFSPNNLVMPQWAEPRGIR